MKPIVYHRRQYGHLLDRRSAGHGFTVLEIMIALVIISILFTMALPSYQQYLRRGHRVAAMDKLLGAANCQQQVYAARFHFDTRLCLPASDDGYNFRFDPGNTAATIIYKVIAVPKGSQILDQCGELILDQSGWRGIGGPEELQRKCWEAR